MKRKLMLLSALTLVAAACGPAATSDGSDQSPSLPADGRSAEVETVVAQPGLRDASPEAITEPVFKPVPEPSPAPSPKPVRPNLPTPPPMRERPSDVAPGPAVPRVPPALDVSPGSSVRRDEPRVAAALADLAARLDLDTNSIDVLDAREVTWRDGSVGCPSPGLAYSQAEVPGFLVVLRNGDSSYRYHSAGDLMPFQCETPQSPLEGSA